MGNCQAAAAVVIQHPQGGRMESLYYWPAAATADEVMKANPGHRVALVTLCIAKEKREDGSGRNVRFTRVRLLQPKDMLLVGQVYKLITSQEVSKALEARRHDELTRTAQPEPVIKKQSTSVGDQSAELDQVTSTAKRERRRRKQSGVRPWRPSLQSISEVVS